MAASTGMCKRNSLIPIYLNVLGPRYLIIRFPNNSNLKRRKITNSGLCSLYLKMQAQLHVFNHSSNALNRYTWRHESITQTFCNHLLKKNSCYLRLYADIEGFDNLTTIFKPGQQNVTSTGPQQNTLLHPARPYVAIEIRDESTVIELTCPFEKNSVKSRKYKQTRYKEIKSELLTPTLNFKLTFFEKTSLGFVTENIKPFRNLS